LSQIFLSIEENSCCIYSTLSRENRAGGSPARISRSQQISLFSDSPLPYRHPNRPYFVIILRPEFPPLRDPTQTRTFDQNEYTRQGCPEHPYPIAGDSLRTAALVAHASNVMSRLLDARLCLLAYLYRSTQARSIQQILHHLLTHSSWGQDQLAGHSRDQGLRTVQLWLKQLRESSEFGGFVDAVPDPANRKRLLYQASGGPMIVSRWFLHAGSDNSSGRGLQPCNDVTEHSLRGNDELKQVPFAFI